MVHGFKWKVTPEKTDLGGYYQDKGETRNDLDEDGNILRQRIQGPFEMTNLYNLGYIQDNITLNEQLNLNVGSRFTHITADIGKFENPQSGLPDQLNNNWDNLSNSLREYIRDDKLNIFAGLSQGFRRLIFLIFQDSIQRDQVK